MLILGLVDIPWWGLILGIILLYALFTCRDFNYFKKQGIPCKMPLPIFGTMYTIFFSDPMDSLVKNLNKEYRDKKCVGGFFGSQPALTVFDEDMLSEIMVKEFQSFTNKSSFKSGSHITDNMLLNLEGAHWKHVRSEMTPTFTSGKLKKMNAEINRCALALADSLLDNQGEVEMREFAGAFTMDVIASTGFGLQVNSLKDRHNEFVEHARNAFAAEFTSPILIVLMFFPWMTKVFSTLRIDFDFFPKNVRDFFERITKQTMELRGANEDKTRTDFIQLMMKAQQGENISDEGMADSSGHKTTGLTTEEICANAMLFFVAGYDTTAITMSFFMHYMAVYPEIQERLAEEIECVVGDQDVLDTNKVQELTYLEQCIMETLRLHPPLVTTNRVASRDITIKGVFIRKGLMVLIPIAALQLHPDKWTDPNSFNPDRFSPENKKNITPYSYMPFSNGPRNCIGMRLAQQELKIAIVQVLRKIKISKSAQTKIPIEVEFKGGLVKPKNVFLNVEPRKGVASD